MRRVDLGELRLLGRGGAARRPASRCAAAEIGDRDGDRAEPQTTTCGRGSTGSTKMSMVPWLGHIFLAKRTPSLLLAGCDALLLRAASGGLHRDEPRPAVGERLLRRLEHCRAGAAAADPAFRDGAVGQDHRLGAGLGGGRRHGAHDGCERERLARRPSGRDQFENVGRRGPCQILARYGSSAARLSRLCAGANRST